jgi:hypothetical protein
VAVAERPAAQVDETSRGGRYAGFAGTILTRSTSFSSLFEAQETDAGWTIRDVETGIFGAGATDADALRDFFAALDEHRDVLERQPALSAELAAQLEYLRRVLG